MPKRLKKKQQNKTKTKKIKEKRGNLSYIRYDVNLGRDDRVRKILRSVMYTCVCVYLCSCRYLCMSRACLARIARNIPRVAGKNQSFLPDECVFAFFFYFTIFFLLLFFSSHESEYPNIHHVACLCLRDRKYNACTCTCVCVCCATRVYVCVRARGCKYNN